MSKGQKLRALVNERLTAAAEEIFELFERTIAEYEEEVHRFKQRNNTQQQLLDQVLEPRVLLHRTGVQFVSVKSGEEVAPSLKPPHIKEEPEEEQLQEFSFPPVSVKSEDDEDKSSVLHQRPTEKNREETNGEDCGTEAGCSSDPLTHLHSDSEHTDHSDDWTQEQTQTETTYTTIHPDSFVRDVEEISKHHQCSDRGKKHKHHLQSHMLTHTGEKPFKCSVCQKGFSHRSNLRQHTLTHTGEKPFGCSVCKKRFSQKSSLRQHALTHTRERPFSCSVCKKCFADRSNLKVHMRVHTGEKPFRCSVCNKGFMQKINLIRHIKTHRPEPKSHLDVHVRDQT